MIKTPNARSSKGVYFNDIKEQEMRPIKDISKAKYNVKNKHLPPNFHEGVLELELLIENDKFDVKTIESLLFLYSVYPLV